jgi:hypothetical protein
MAKDKAAERRRDRARDLDTLRVAVELGRLAHGTDRRIRRLVKRGWATQPEYAYGAARDATAVVTDAGRAEVERWGTSS